MNGAKDDPFVRKGTLGDCGRSCTELLPEHSFYPMCLTGKLSRVGGELSRQLGRSGDDEWDWGSDGGGREGSRYFCERRGRSCDGARGDEIELGGIF